MPNRNDYDEESTAEKWKRFASFNAVDLDQIKRDITSIKNVLNGDGEKAGLIVTVKFLEEYILAQKKQALDLGTFVFRAFLTITITYIAYKVGLKP